MGKIPTNQYTYITWYKYKISTENIIREFEGKIIASR